MASLLLVIIRYIFRTAFPDEVHACFHFLLAALHKKRNHRPDTDNFYALRTSTLKYVSERVNYIILNVKNKNIQNNNYKV